MILFLPFFFFWMNKLNYFTHFEWTELDSTCFLFIFFTNWTILHMEWTELGSIFYFYCFILFCVVICDCILLTYLFLFLYSTSGCTFRRYFSQILLVQKSSKCGLYNGYYPGNDHTNLLFWLSITKEWSLACSEGRSVRNNAYHSHCSDWPEKRFPCEYFSNYCVPYFCDWTSNNNHSWINHSFGSTNWPNALA